MPRIEALPEGLVDALGRPEGHPHDPSARMGVETRQTHISHLFLTRDRVSKVRKAVELDFLSFATRDERNADCLREVSLNRRLAPDVYLGVAPILEDGANGYLLGPCGETCESPPGASRPAEHAVVMRRLPADRNAKALLEAGALDGEKLDRLAGVLARFHAGVGIGRPAPYGDEAWLARVLDPVTASFGLARDTGRDVLDADRLDRLEASLHRRLDSDRARFLARRDEGRIVDGHGDLHLDAVWYEHVDADPVVIDCLEFDADLRRIDTAAELAFFVMDTAYRSRADLGERLLRTYAALADDYGLYGVVDFHVLHRALVRAGVAAVATTEAEIDARQRDEASASARRHLDFMEDWLARPPRPFLLLTCGLPGTGKSTVAVETAARTGAVAIVSDRVRAHLAGRMDDAEHADRPGDARYGESVNEAVYAGLLERAEPVLASGRPVVLDATYSREVDRRRVVARCREWGIRPHLLAIHCGHDETLARLRARLHDPSRISDAGPAVHRLLRERFEEPHEWNEDDRIDIATDDPEWASTLRNGLRAAGLELPGS